MPFTNDDARMYITKVRWQFATTMDGVLADTQLINRARVDDSTSA